MSKEITPEGNYLINGSLYHAIVYDKYLENMRNGFRTLSSGAIIPFTGFSVDQNNGTSLRAYYTDETTDVIHTRLIRPIEESAKVNGIHIYSGALWTLHTSISDLRYIPDITPGNCEKTLDQVSKDSRLPKTITSLDGLEVEFETLFGGNAITLAATHLPAEILEARRQMTQIAHALDMQEKDFTNIFHITLARLAPQSTTTVGFYPFARDLMKIHHELLHNPIKAKISKAEVMTNEQLNRIHQIALIDAVAKCLISKERQFKKGLSPESFAPNSHTFLLLQNQILI